ncbi:MAG TPA: hypothetical protein QGF58_18110 [Myxococcota bacterium]|nr:hypothetical protein [Myxococcota bacterium]
MLLWIACAAPMSEPELAPTPEWLAEAPKEVSLAATATVLGVPPGLYSKHGHLALDVDPKQVGTGLIVTRKLDDRTGFIDSEGARFQLRERDGRWLFGDLAAVQRYAEPGRMELDGVELIAGAQQAWVRPRRIFADLLHVQGVEGLWLSSGYLLEDIDQVAFGWDEETLRLRATCSDGCSEANATSLRRFIAGIRASMDCPSAWRGPLRRLRVGLFDDVIAGAAKLQE